MVDSGDLANANKEKKGMENRGQTEPLAVQKFAQEQEQESREGSQAGRDEAARRNELEAQSRALGVTGQKQKDAKSDLEKKREEVATKINGIYTAAQDKVKKKLADLETAVDEAV